jgi:hypothetical protein
MATNNNGNLLDSSGNVAVDFVWGNFPMQPNDDRTDGTAVVKVASNASENKSWSGYSVYPSARLNPALANHAVVEADWAGYPSFIAATGKYNITQVSGDGTTVRYESYNFFNGGETVDITGCNGFNLSGATIATATRDYFTVTNSTTGSLININNGIVQRTDAASAADGAGIAYIVVPSVVGYTTANALDVLQDSGYEAANITTATAATNTATQPTRINVTSTTAATVTVAGGTATWLVGTKIAIAAGTGIPTALVGTWTVTGGSGSTLTIAGSGWTVADTGAITPGTVLTGKTGTIKTQSTAANSANVATTATITITPWA